MKVIYCTRAWGEGRGMRKTRRSIIIKLFRWWWNAKKLWRNWQHYAFVNRWKRVCRLRPSFGFAFSIKLVEKLITRGVEEGYSRLTEWFLLFYSRVVFLYTCRALIFFSRWQKPNEKSFQTKKGEVVLDIIKTAPPTSPICFECCFLIEEKVSYE